MMHHRIIAILIGMALVGCAHHAPRRVSAPPAVPVETAPSKAPTGPKSRYQLEHDTGPAVPADISAIPEPAVEREPRSAYGNQSPYTVLGHTYNLREDCAGYVERGIASWYGMKFHGHLTSNRESYDMYRYSAAHKTLPLPCFARVTNLDNGRSIVVRINDRGPFHENRLIDLSYVAAVKLGIQANGTGLVEVRALAPEQPELPETRLAQGAPAAARKASLYVQAGAFADRDNAQRLESRLAHAGVRGVFLDRIERGGRPLHRVRIGPLGDVDSADRLTAQLQRLGIASVAVSID